MLIDVRKHSPSAHPNKKETMKVRVVVTNPCGTGILWIHVSDFRWLVEYLADEVITGGVEKPARSAVAGRTPNCKTPWLSVRLVPHEGHMNKYEATFVGGPLAGQALESNIIKFSQEKWDKCMPTADQWTCPGPLITDGNPADISRACAHFLELTMARKLLRHYFSQAQADEVQDPIAGAKRAAEQDPVWG